MAGKHPPFGFAEEIPNIAVEKTILLFWQNRIITRHARRFSDLKCSFWFLCARCSRFLIHNIHKMALKGMHFIAGIIINVGEYHYQDNSQQYVYIRASAPREAEAFADRALVAL